MFIMIKLCYSMVVLCSTSASPWKVLVNAGNAPQSADTSCHVNISIHFIKSYIDEFGISSLPTPNQRCFWIRFADKYSKRDYTNRLVWKEYAKQIIWSLPNLKAFQFLYSPPFKKWTNNPGQSILVYYPWRIGRECKCISAPNSPSRTPWFCCKFIMNSKLDALKNL